VNTTRLPSSVFDDNPLRRRSALRNRSHEINASALVRPRCAKRLDRLLPGYRMKEHTCSRYLQRRPLLGSSDVRWLYGDQKDFLPLSAAYAHMPISSFFAGDGESERNKLGKLIGLFRAGKSSSAVVILGPPLVYNIEKISLHCRTLCAFRRLTFTTSSFAIA